jgi:hypothetical protein
MIISILSIYYFLSLILLYIKKWMNKCKKKNNISLLRIYVSRNLIIYYIY